ncbi:MAG: hypothetical protein ACRDEA_14980 [Microcystaceae cyanobacterium]
MKANNLDSQSHDSSQAIRAQARLLMSQSRQRQQNRQQSMLQRAAGELGINK